MDIYCNHLNRNILEHLEFWEKRNHDPPKKKIRYVFQITYDDTFSQVPPKEIDYRSQVQV